MRCVVQRVSAATVAVDGREVGRCGFGLMLLVGVHKDDTAANAAKLADRVAGMRIFSDAAGKMNLSILQLREEGHDEADILAVSNFTLFGDTSQRRPSFGESAGFEKGQELFEAFVQELRGRGIPVQTGVFGANMQVSILNDGPVTLIVDA